MGAMADFGGGSAAFSPAAGMGSSVLRAPPANLQAEQAILGAILANNGAYDRVADILETQHFADAAHARIYEAIGRRIMAGKLADAVTIRAQFEADGDLADVGGAAYLADILSAMIGSVNVRQYAEIVIDCATRRSIIQACEEAVTRAYRPADECGASEIASELDGALLGLRSAGAGSDLHESGPVAQRVLSRMAQMATQGDGMAGLSTGLTALDDLLGGLLAGKHYVIAGRSSMGKSALAAAVAVGAARKGRRVYFLTIEMDPEDIQARMIAGYARAPLLAVTRGWVPGEGKLIMTSPMARQIEEGGYAVSQLPIIWDGSSSPSVPDIRSRIRQRMRRGGIDLVVIDYLQLLRASAATRGNLYAAATENSRSLKALAKDLGVPIVTLSQLSRGVEGREDQRPRMSDLRDSGAIEEDADSIMLLYREHYYLTRGEPAQKLRESDADFQQRKSEWSLKLQRAEGRAELDVAKNRQGRTGVVHLAFDDASTWFTDPPNDESRYAAQHA